ncbi:hypothetical protein [Metabacillus fastidiosus]|uniref:hypothetical protein n=1 Tax=Metabacillus fastidiosus TaxID=1458 RepID=UPI002DBFBB95|nr:hypothetical protein [Metabacillus fastidiosus]MEC2077513.1 hypothetical protein [Metabacillus fastidiosus]
MFHHIAVFGVHTSAGFKLCEFFINAGTEVDAIITDEKEMAEERLMLIGRNALLKIHEQIDFDEVNSKNDFIYYCCDEKSEHISERFNENSPSNIIILKIMDDKQEDISDEVIQVIINKSEINEKYKIIHIQNGRIVDN